MIAVAGITFIFAMTTLGSAAVYLFRDEISPETNTAFLGFASGIMVAASVWSLLIPSIDLASGIKWLPAAAGMAAGGLFLVLLDRTVPHIHGGINLEEGPRVSLKKSTKLFLAITIHNIPEGLAVGFAFGAAASAGTQTAMISALGLAAGIGIQNFPEGAAVSLPMKKAAGSRSSAFMYGAASGAVEPVCAAAGYFMSAYISFLQPWFLAFAAGAMLFVVVEDLIPESHISDRPHLGTWSFMTGFVVMMILDVALG